MTTIPATSHTTSHADTTRTDLAGSIPVDYTPTQVTAPPNEFFTGNPAAVGLPVFIAGSVALGLVLIGYVPATAVAASIPVIAAATGLGLTLSTVWAAAVGQSAVASVFAIFGGFWLSYATLVLGLTHNWFAIPAKDIVHTEALFLIVWLVVIGLLTLATLRLPSAFTLLFVLVCAALAVVLVATIRGSADWQKAGGYIVFAFAAVGAYLYAGVAATATGGDPLPLGRPIIGASKKA